jgi:hypothetical protein
MRLYIIYIYIKIININNKQIEISDLVFKFGVNVEPIHI